MIKIHENDRITRKPNGMVLIVRSDGSILHGQIYGCAEFFVDGHEEVVGDYDCLYCQGELVFFVPHGDKPQVGASGTMQHMESGMVSSDAAPGIVSSWGSISCYARQSRYGRASYARDDVDRVGRPRPAFYLFGNRGSFYASRELLHSAPTEDIFAHFSYRLADGEPIRYAQVSSASANNKRELVEITALGLVVFKQGTQLHSGNKEPTLIAPQGNMYFLDQGSVGTDWTPGVVSHLGSVRFFLNDLPVERKEWRNNLREAISRRLKKTLL